MAAVSPKKNAANVYEIKQRHTAICNQILAEKKNTFSYKTYSEVLSLQYSTGYRFYGVELSTYRLFKIFFSTDFHSDFLTQEYPFERNVK